jgi:hypothetical protein
MIIDMVTAQQSLPDKEKFVFWEKYRASLAAGE